MIDYGNDLLLPNSYEENNTDLDSLGGILKSPFLSV